MCRVEDRTQKLVQLIRLDPPYRLFVGDKPLVDHVNCNLDGRERGAFADAALKHVEHSLLDCEFDIHHIAVVFLEGLAYLIQVLVELRIVSCKIGNREWGPGACDNILTLGIHQKLAVEYVFSGSGITRERNAGSGVLPHVSEHHSLDIDGGAP